MVDPQRKSVRDVLRNPAGLNDTLFDMIAMATTADAAPTSQTKAVSREVMAKVDSEVAKFDALVAGDIAELNAGARQGARPIRDGGLSLKGSRTMDFIERHLRLSPDNGDSSTEICGWSYWLSSSRRPCISGPAAQGATGSRTPLSLRRDRTAPPRGPTKIRSAAALHSGPSPDRC